MGINSINGYLWANPVSGAASAKKPAEDGAGTQAGETTRTDKVDISPEASFVSELGKYNKTYSAKVKAPATPERLNELKEKYSGNQCPVSGSEIAAKIIAGIVGPGPND